MSKIICDFCGTSYQETATQCPICGSVRPGNIGAVSDHSGEAQPRGEYQFVKGGRFSKANVKKRNQGKVFAPEDSADDIHEGSSNRGLIIAIIVLFIAIVAVVTFIVLRFLTPGENSPSQALPVATETTASTLSSTAPTEEQPSVIICESIKVSKTPEPFEKEGDGILLSVDKSPENTTQKVEFYSSDKNVATVSDKGMVTAVGYGEAIITVKCGDAETSVIVTCTFGNAEDPTQPTEPDEPATEQTFEFKTNTGEMDITFSYKGESTNIYTGTIPVDQITWSSEDEEVATFVNGVITATGKNKPGTSYIKVYAKYGDKEVECIVRCSSSVGEYTPPVVEEPEPEPEPDYTISDQALTLRIGDRYNIYLTGKDGENAKDVRWVVEGEDKDSCVVYGSTIHAVKEGVCIVATEFDGVPYGCTVTVEAAS